MWRRITTVAWWLGVSVYFGGLLTLGMVVAPVLFDTTTKAGMSMPGIVSPPLNMGGEVGGEIFGNVVNRFTIVEVVALALMAIGLVGYILSHRPVRRSAWVLLILWIALLGFMAYDSLLVTPKVFTLRDQVRHEAADHVADKPDTPWPARTDFHAFHDQAEALGRWQVYLLFGMILVSASRGLAERPAKPAEKHPQTTREEV